MRCTLLIVVALLAPFAPAQDKLERFIATVQRADYRGERTVLEGLYETSGDLATGPYPKQWVHYWRGFALWRAAFNGFNDNAGKKALEEDLQRAVDEFDLAIQVDPRCYDAMLAKSSCLITQLFLRGSKPEDVKRTVPQAASLLLQCEASDPTNPRLYWVRGPMLWYSPAHGEVPAFATYRKGLSNLRRSGAAQRYAPTWGEPELCMSLAWSEMHRSEPNPIAAEQWAIKALKAVPDWHYVRDILLPQIRARKLSTSGQNTHREAR